ncbi:hypothetical protein BCR33DRAFT_309152 [Rhizoclosmatium globosum]|uniref:RRM domain-containing protein n=1 Tax=Rhizoclosmatium globosum TaxID=329046 RepID=A0A1Y2C5S4_9FUNG|nr:hypothetical protein BCR33DRAFT_309152 [Rhizoclosmatium globosum]|eukprot:ORY42381.1 hypothetical protein BCR33DRAFT_309152 [Rhizoclosmatium globosum]
MLARAAEPPSSNQEIRVLVSDYDIGNFVSNLGCHVEANVIISSMPSNQLFQTDILNCIREVLTSERSIVSNAFHQKLFGILELSRSGQFEQELPLSVDLKYSETRNLQIRSSNDQVSCIVTDIGRRRYRTLSCLPTEVTTLKSDDNFKSNPRPVSNSWDYASRSTDITPSNASSPGDWIHESSQAIMRPASVKSVTDTSTIFKTEFDTLSDMTEVSEMEATGISTVLVGNFPDETTEAELKYRFRNVNILRCKIVNNKKADRKPFAFLDVKECDRDAVLKMNGERFHGLKLKVEYDPSRLEKLGRKRSDSVKLEMSSIVVADTPVPSIPHTLKKSNSLNALEFYTSSNPQANSAMAFRPNSQVPKTGTMIRTRSQLLNSTQLAQNYESWMEPNNPESSSSPSLTQSYLPPMTLHQSPVTAKSSLALKSSWDSPPRKKDTFTTGASWEKVESNNSNQSCSKNNLPPSWSINVRADSTGVDLNQWDQPQRHVAYRTNSNSSSVDQSEYSTYSSPDNFHLPAHSGSGPVDVGRTHWGGAPSQLMKLPGDQWGESITPMDRRDFNSLTSIDHRRLSQTRETSMKTNAMASVMSFNQQLMSGVGLATGAGLTEGHRRPSLVNLSAFSHGPSVEYDAISSWYPPNIETAVENGGMAGFVKRGNSGISGVSGWQPHQPSTKSLYEKNIW